MNLKAIRKALADVLDAGLSVNSYAYAPGSPDAPAVFIYPLDGSYHATYEDGTDLKLGMRWFVSSNSMEAGQDQLDDFISTEGSDSAKVLIETDGTLGGIVQSTSVESHDHYGAVTLPDGIVYLSAHQVVSILT